MKANLHAGKIDEVIFYRKNKTLTEYLVLKDIEHFHLQHFSERIAGFYAETTIRINMYEKMAEMCLGPFQKWLEILT